MPVTPSTAFFDANAWLSPTPATAPAGLVPHPTLPEAAPTVWETLKASAGFSIFVEQLSRFPDLIGILDGKKDCTLFALPNAVLETSHLGLSGTNLTDLPKEDTYEILQMHLSPNFMPSTFLATAPNVPILLCPPTLNGAMVINSRRLSEETFLLNDNVRTKLVDLLCSNGVIHILDSILLPPPSSLTILSLLPASEYSTFQKALVKTGLEDELRSTPQRGGIIFVPTNTAFTALGLATYSFLFSDTPSGTACLKVLLKYHIVRDETFYSNIHYKNPLLNYDYEHPKLQGEEAKKHVLRHIAGVRRRTVTSLLGRKVNIDLRRDGGVIEVGVNGRALVVRDGNASDGVVHVIGGVMVPPPRELVDEEWDEREWKKGEWSVEELRERLEGWL